MLKYLIIISFLSINISFANNLEQRRKELFLMRQLINRAEPPQELEGRGIIFHGNVNIETITVNDEEHKVYKGYIRNCGLVELPKKDDNFMKKVNNGARVKLRFKSSCIVQDWELF